MSASRPGIKAVAARAGVGIATVSRVFSGSAEVTPATKRRVVDAARELGYRPDILAQSLRLGATTSAGFITDDLSNHLNIDIATGAEQVLRSHRYSLLVMNSEMEPGLDAQNIGVLQSRRVDALMMTPVTEDDPALISVLGGLDIPIVIVDGDLPGVSQASFVLSDHRGGAAAALRFLIELGHRRISVLAGPDDFRSARERRMAVEQVASEASSETAIRHVVTELTAEGGRDASREELGRDEPPTALVVGGDQLLTGVLDVVGSLDLTLGRDISLVTSDPVALAGVFRPALATITRDAIGLGHQAAEIMLRALADRTLPPERVVLPTEFEPRDSIGPPPGS
jgi:LacI family transcriptional regulator